MPIDDRLHKEVGGGSLSTLAELEGSFLILGC